MEVPAVQYAMTSDDVRIAYQDFGEGPPTIYVPPFFNHIEGVWEQQLHRRVFERMAPHLRVLLIENRGTGLSDGFEETPSARDRARDLAAVIDASGLTEVNLVGVFAGSQVCVAYAVEEPDKVSRLVLANPRIGRKMKEEADALKPHGLEAYDYEIERRTVIASETLGSGLNDHLIDDVANSSPSGLDHPEYLRWLPRYQRMWGSRESVRRQAESIGPLETAELSRDVTQPTLITSTAGNRIIHVGHSRLLAELIPDSTLVEFPGKDHYYWLGSNWGEIVDRQISFITGHQTLHTLHRKFAVVLFTDIVESTSNSYRAGDASWADTLNTHDHIASIAIERNGGQIVKHTGDGLLATFSSPSSAIAAASEMRQSLSDVGLSIRAGLHAGEIEIRGEDVSGAVVNLAARVEEAAPAGEIFVTLALRDLLIGAQHEFEASGTHQLRGFGGDWLLYRLSS